MTAGALLWTVCVYASSQDEQSSIPPSIILPDAGDDVITSVHELLLKLNSTTADISLKVDANISLGGWIHPNGLGYLGEFGYNRSVTLWSDTGATIDAQGMGRVLHLSNQVKMLLQNIELTGGVAPPLDAMSAIPGGGGCIYMSPSDPWLMLRNSRLSNCVARGGGSTNLVAFGGAVLKNGGILVLEATVVENCHVENIGTAAFAAGGGGIFVLHYGELSLYDVRFVNTTVSVTNGPLHNETSEVSSAQRWAFGGAVGIACACQVRMQRVHFSEASVYSALSRAWGGAVGVWSNSIRGQGYGADALPQPPASVEPSTTIGGQTLIGNSSFDGCHAISLATSGAIGTSHAWGGAIGLAGGVLEVRHSTITASAASGADAAFGGGLGIWAMAAGLGDTSLTVMSSSFNGNGASSEHAAIGGSIGVQSIDSPVATESLTTVSLLDTVLSSSNVLADIATSGYALGISPLADVSAALLVIQQDCSGDAAAPLVAGGEVALAEGRLSPTFPPTTVLLRNLTIDAPSCTQWMHPNVTLPSCASDDVSPCGPMTECFMSDIGQSLSIPSCTCAPGFEPNPMAEMAELAVFAEGCGVPSPPSPPPAPEQSSGDGIGSMIAAAMVTFAGMGVMIWRHHSAQRE